MTDPEKIDQLLVCANRGDLAGVRELLEKGVDVNSRDEGLYGDDDGRTALMSAAGNGQAEA